MCGRIVLHHGMLKDMIVQRKSAGSCRKELMVTVWKTLFLYDYFFSVFSFITVICNYVFLVNLGCRSSLELPLTAGSAKTRNYLCPEEEVLCVVTPTVSWQQCGAKEIEFGLFFYSLFTFLNIIDTFI